MKYLHKLVEVMFNGKEEIGFVIDESINPDGTIEIRVLIQRTKQKLYFNTGFGKPKLLEE